MSEIRKGDLVMIIRPQPCCGMTKAIGKSFVVATIEGDCYCLGCRAQHGNQMVAFSKEDEGVLVSRLIKIDPPALEDNERQELGKPVTTT